MRYTADTPVNKFRPEVTGEALRLAALAIRPNNNPIANLTGAFVEAGRKYNVDQVYLLAHAILESAWGTSRIAIDKKNLFGYRAYDRDPYNSAQAWNTFEEGIDFVTRFIANQYLSPSGRWYGGSPTLRGMNVRYATAGHWADSIATITQRLQDSLPSGSAKPAPSPTYQVYDSGVNEVTIAHAKGVNVRRSAEVVTTNLVKALAQNTKVKVQGFVRGENVNGNDLWWVTSDGHFVWTGATNHVPSLQSKEPAPIDTGAGGLSIEELTLEAKRLEKLTKEVASKNSKLKEENQKLITERDELQSRIIGLEREVNELVNLKTVNKALEETIREQNDLLGEGEKDRGQVLATAFEGWELSQLKPGLLGMFKLPLIATRVILLLWHVATKKIVIGWKLNAEIIEV